MGYRSEVSFITTKEGWNIVDEAVRAVEGDGDVYHLTEDATAIPIVDGKYILAEWHDIKWYQGNDLPISTFMNQLDKLEELGIPFHYLRMGEDWEDIDNQTYDGEDWKEWSDMPGLGLKREIEVEY